MIHALSVAWEPLKWEGAWWYFVRESDTGGDRPCMDNDKYNFAADGRSLELINETYRCLKGEN